jgi:hypothetical protein
MPGTFQPLVDNQRVVNPDGTPTEYFIRWAQEKQIAIGEGITAEQALAIVQQFTADHPLIAGSGIILTPSGDLADDVTIGADVQAILDQISTTWGSVLFRGTADWQALAPGTAGQFLKTNGAGADPAWAAAGGGGGGLTVISDQTLVAAAASIDVTSIAATYKDLVVAFTGRGTGANAFVLLQMNADTAANYDYINMDTFGAAPSAGAALAQTKIQIAQVPGSANTAGMCGITEMIIPNYTGTSFRKRANSRWSMAATGFEGEGEYSGQWRNTAAITGISIFLSAGNLDIGSRVTVYGRG